MHQDTRGLELTTASAEAASRGGCEPGGRAAKTIETTPGPAMAVDKREKLHYE